MGLKVASELRKGLVSWALLAGHGNQTGIDMAATDAKEAVKMSPAENSGGYWDTGPRRAILDVTGTVLSMGEDYCFELQDDTMPRWAERIEYYQKNSNSVRFEHSKDVYE